VRLALKVAVQNDGDFVDVILLCCTCKLLMKMTDHQFFGTAKDAVQCRNVDTNLERHPLIHVLLTCYVIMQEINCKKYVRSGVSTETLLNVEIFWSVKFCLWMSGFYHSSWNT
jgi:hypothetical protein